MPPPPFFRPSAAPSRREEVAAYLQARRAWRTALIVLVAVLAGLVAAFFARLCDAAMELHGRLYEWSPAFTLSLLPIGFATAVWLPRRFAPEAAGFCLPNLGAGSCATAATARLLLFQLLPEPQ